MATQKELRIIIAMDRSKFSDYAFQWYLDNIHKPTDFVILLYCMEYQSIAVMPGDIGASGLLVETLETERRIADQYIEELTEKMRAANLHGLVKRCTGSARSEIIRVAEEERVDLIITGTRGMGTIRRTFLGSVSDHVLHHAHVPVIICRNQDELQ